MGVLNFQFTVDETYFAYFSNYCICAHKVDPYHYYDNLGVLRVSSRILQLIYVSTVEHGKEP